eukprot:g8403.t1
MKVSSLEPTYNDESPSRFRILLDARQSVELGEAFERILRTDAPCEYENLQNQLGENFLYTTAGLPISFAVEVLQFVPRTGLSQTQTTISGGFPTTASATTVSVHLLANAADVDYTKSECRTFVRACLRSAKCLKKPGEFVVHEAEAGAAGNTVPQLLDARISKFTFDKVLVSAPSIADEVLAAVERLLRHREVMASFHLSGGQEEGHSAEEIQAIEDTFSPSNGFPPPRLLRGANGLMPAFTSDEDAAGGAGGSKNANAASKDASAKSTTTTIFKCARRFLAKLLHEHFHRVHAPLREDEAEAAQMWQRIRSGGVSVGLVGSSEQNACAAGSSAAGAGTAIGVKKKNQKDDQRKKSLVAADGGGGKNKKRRYHTRSIARREQEAAAKQGGGSDLATTGPAPAGAGVVFPEEEAAGAGVLPGPFSPSSPMLSDVDEEGSFVGPFSPDSPPAFGTNNLSSDHPAIRHFGAMSPEIAAKVTRKLDFDSFLEEERERRRREKLQLQAKQKENKTSKDSTSDSGSLQQQERAFQFKLYDDALLTHNAGICFANTPGGTTSLLSKGSCTAGPLMLLQTDLRQPIVVSAGVGSGAGGNDNDPFGFAGSGKSINSEGIDAPKAGRKAAAAGGKETAGGSSASNRRPSNRGARQQAQNNGAAPASPRIGKSLGRRRTDGASPRGSAKAKEVQREEMGSPPRRRESKTPEQGRKRKDSRELHDRGLVSTPRDGGADALFVGMDDDDQSLANNDAAGKAPGRKKSATGAVAVGHEKSNQAGDQGGPGSQNKRPSSSRARAAKISGAAFIPADQQHQQQQQLQAAGAAAVQLSHHRPSTALNFQKAKARVDDALESVFDNDCGHEVAPGVYVGPERMFNPEDFPNHQKMIESLAIHITHVVCVSPVTVDQEKFPHLEVLAHFKNTSDREDTDIGSIFEEAITKMHPVILALAKGERVGKDFAGFARERKKSMLAVKKSVVEREESQIHEIALPKADKLQQNTFADRIKEQTVMMMKDEKEGEIASSCPALGVLLSPPEAAEVEDKNASDEAAVAEQGDTDVEKGRKRKKRKVSADVPSSAAAAASSSSAGSANKMKKSNSVGAAVVVSPDVVGPCTSSADPRHAVSGTAVTPDEATAASAASGQLSQIPTCLFIHCREGCSRSATLWIAYIHDDHGQGDHHESEQNKKSLHDPDEIAYLLALRTLKQARWVAAPNSGFKQQLQRFARAGKFRAIRSKLQEVDVVARWLCAYFADRFGQWDKYQSRDPKAKLFLETGGCGADCGKFDREVVLGCEEAWRQKAMCLFDDGSQSPGEEARE